MTIACYVRASTTRQSLDDQRAELRKWLDDNGIDRRDVKWFTETKSGKSSKRQEFDRLQGEILDEKVNKVVVSSLESLSRPLNEGVRILADWCNRGLNVVVVTQQLEFGEAVGRALAAVLPGLAEMDRAYRRERQKPGIEVARKAGAYLGRKKGTTKSNPEQVAELWKKGHTVEQIARSLGISKRTVWRYLKK